MKRVAHVSMRSTLALLALAPLAASASAQDVAVRAKLLHTMAGEPLRDAVVLVQDGKIAAVGKQGTVPLPDGIEVREATVVTPGLIDAHSVVGLAGWLNYDHDADEQERSAPIQPELRAIDAYNPREPLVEYLRGYGVTTLHTGHAPTSVISGQTMIVKTAGDTVDEAVVVPFAMVAATFGDAAVRDGEVPGTRSKAVAILRQKLIEAQAYMKKRDGDDEKKPDRDLTLETLASVLRGDVPLMITANRANDILTAVRVAREFEVRLVLDGAAEIMDVLDEVNAANASVLLHPTMARSTGDRENASMETAAKLAATGKPFALQGGYESYVPKTRVVLFEAGVAAAYGLPFERALASITIDAARILGIDARVGSIEVGKDGDLALYDGDPFEYTSHCIGTIVEGVVVSEEVR